MPKTAPEEGAKRIPIPEIYKKAEEKPKAPEPVRPMPNVRVYEPAPPSGDKPKTPAVRTFEPPVEHKETKPEPTERCEAVIPKPAPAEKAPEQAKPQDDTFFAKTIDETEQPSGIPSYRLIGEAFSCYLFVETGDRVLIIDKHAAHERILFEDMKNNMKRSDLQAQVLMLPIRVPLSSEERSALCEYENDVRAIGFAYRVTDRGAEISEIPDGLSLSAAQEMFETVADRLANGSGDAEKTRYEYFEHALYQASCKAAVKGGRNYDEAHVKWICDRVLTDPAVRYCPHGRPVGFEMTKSQFEKRFERSK